MEEMTTRAAIMNAVLEAIRDTNAVLPPDGLLEVSENATLLEPAGKLDSLGLVNLLVAVETRCQAASGRSISLTDAIVAPPEDSPFRTVRTLVAHIENRLSLETTDV
jgi:acyl carrier protein